MKIALLHDYLNQWGGAERVLHVLAQMFPEADIYTLFYDKEKLTHRFAGNNIKTSFIDHPVVHNNHRLFIPIMPLAARLLKVKNDYDLIISDSAGFAKGFRHSKKTKHICYCHTPLRYAWEPEYITSKYKDLSGGVVGKLASAALSYLKSWDLEASKRPDLMLANSGYIADKIKKYYDIEAQVLHPPIDTKFFSYDPKIKKGKYFLAVGRFMHYKKFDLIIKAFNKLKLPLKVVGDGPESSFLTSMASDFPIEFIKNPSDEELRSLYRSAKALIFPQVEDFGMVAAEAIACGTPVLAYAQGGALEIVEDAKNGLFFSEQTPESLASAVEKFLKKRWDKKKISLSAEKFSADNFKKEFLNIIERVQNPEILRLTDSPPPLGKEK